jgi:CheY-like chemotaxis protein
VILPYQVMLLDDDSITNFLTESLLREAGFGHPIHIFTDPLEALHFIQINCNPVADSQPEVAIPDVMFVDANMVSMNGFEFLERLKQVCPPMYRDTFFCLLTNSSRSDDAKKALESGYNTYIQKPLTDEKLKSVIELLLSRSV